MTNRERILKEVSQITNPESSNFFLIAGPCVVESEAMVFDIAAQAKEVCAKLNIPYFFKASYRKANRSSSSSFSGLGDEKAFEILEKVRRELSVPVVSDIHSAAEAAIAAKYIDVLQIPAFLCRQSDILEAAAATGKIVNVKKGQFLSAESMVHVVKKLEGANCDKIMLTERGTTFGYQDLVVDFRSMPIMAQNGYPVVMDVTHSLQQPNQSGGVTGGRPELIETIARAAIATGADGLFIETHQNPAVALSDGANMLKLELLEPLLEKMSKLKSAVNGL